MNLFIMIIGSIIGGIIGYSLWWLIALKNPIDFCSYTEGVFTIVPILFGILIGSMVGGLF